jgi:hypothetical protein
MSPKAAPHSRCGPARGGKDDLPAAAEFARQRGADAA